VCAGPAQRQRVCGLRSPGVGGAASITVATAASFLTPIATPTNLMVTGPGGYAFGDDRKLGLPLMIWFFVVAVLWVPLVWSF
jgi:di/tricarboxylate transporter